MKRFLSLLLFCTAAFAQQTQNNSGGTNVQQQSSGPNSPNTSQVSDTTTMKVPHEKTALEEKAISDKAKADSDAEHAAAEAKARAIREVQEAQKQGKEIPCETCKPVEKPEVKEAISELMLDAQDTQQQLQSANIQAEQKVRDFIAPFQQRADTAMKAYVTALTKLQEESNAKGCILTFKKKWVNCPPAPATPAPTAAVAPLPVPTKEEKKSTNKEKKK